MGGGYESTTLTSLASDARDYPALYPFGTELRDFLDAAAERTAPFEERLRSVWRYIVGRVKRFSGTLRPREAAILDAEDIIHTIVEQLIAKDHFWDPDRGKYSTFVETVIRNVLSTCHERARPVSGPANSYGRLLGYHQRLTQGTLSRGMHSTMLAISCVMEDFDSVEEAPDHPSDDADSPTSTQTLRKALRSLPSPVHVWALVRKYGVLGEQAMSYRQIARTLGIKQGHARALVEEAMQSLRRSLAHETL